MSKIWAGSEVVRQAGNVGTLELVVYRENSAEQISEHEDSDLETKSQRSTEDIELRSFSEDHEVYHVTDLADACAMDLYRISKPNQCSLLSSLAQELRLVGTYTLPRASEICRGQAYQSPNITLNIDKAVTKIWETWVSAIIGTLLQPVALITPGLMVYHWHFKKGNNAIQAYAYPTFLAGSCVMMIGIALCSHIIEANSVEHVFEPKKDTVGAVFRLQFACTVGDQNYEPFVIMNPLDSKSIHTSRRPWESNSTRKREQNLFANLLTILAVSMSPFGFILQFVGLRALHWLATVTQLAVTLAITAAHSWVRRGLVRAPATLQPYKSDPNWIALAVGTSCLSGGPDAHNSWSKADVSLLEIHTGTVDILRSSPLSSKVLMYAAPVTKTNTVALFGSDEANITQHNMIPPIRDSVVRAGCSSTSVTEPKIITMKDPRISLRYMLH